MNKYQEALNGAIKRTNIMNNCCSFIGECFKNGDCKFNDAKLMCDDYVCFKTLHELVEKATPKKPKYKEIIRKDNYRDGTNISRYDWWCPNCHLEHMSTNEIKYCPTCGQDLDWSDEE